MGLSQSQEQEQQPPSPRQRRRGAAARNHSERMLSNTLDISFFLTIPTCCVGTLARTRKLLT